MAKGSIAVKISVMDTELGKGIVDLLKEIIEDTRIQKEIREEYNKKVDKLMKIGRESDDTKDDGL